MLLDKLSHIGNRKLIHSNYALIDYNQKTEAVFLIIKGGVALYDTHPKSLDERAINFSTPNFNPLASSAKAYLHNENSNYALRTFTKTELIEIQKSVLNEFITNNNLWKEYNQYALNSLVEVNELRAKLITLTTPEMIEYLHQQYPQIIKLVPAKYIANFLGVTPEWYSKLKRKK
jgi:hypothetical protein